MNYMREQEFHVPSIQRREKAEVELGYLALGKKIALLPFQVIFLLLFTFPISAPVLFLSAWIYMWLHSL